MKQPDSTKLGLTIAQGLSILLIAVFGLFGLVISLYMHDTLERDFSEIQRQDFERRMDTYVTLVNHFINMHSRQIEDLSTQSIFEQAVMQPKAMRASIGDHMDGIQIMGKKVQMVLLDFEGTTIHATQPSPLFDYQREPWVSQMMTGKITNHFELHEDQVVHFLSFATAIYYNGQPEGILLTEVPVDALAKSYSWSTEIQQEQLQIFHDGHLILSLGPDLSTMPSVSVELPEKHLQMVGHLDESELQAISHNLLQKFIWIMILLATGAIAIIFGLSRKMFITPLAALRETTTAIANGKFSGNQSHGGEADRSLSLSKYQFREVNALTHDVVAMAKIINLREHSLQEANVTLERRVEERTQELEGARDEALSASRTKSGFLATMSHEIRTPMNAILGILGLLKNTSLDSQQREWVQTGRESGELLLTIINDILDFSKMEADKLELEQSCFNLQHMFGQTIRLLEPQAERKGLNLSLKLEAGLPDFASGDPDRLRQILINLINNAIKFTSYGAITVRVSATAGSDETIILHCIVEDSGVGIPQEQQLTLFDEFTMADQSHSRIHEGTGLGLAICKRLVALMRGTIGVTSDVGKGSAFFFDAVLGSATEQECDNLPALDEPQRLPDSSVRVLLAEDNTANQMVIRVILEHAGLQVDMVANGREAVDAVRSLPYDIVLMDISMPLMDGIAATHEIRQLSGEVSKIPIVALTAHALSGDRERFLAAGMDDYLTKPIDRAATLDCIARLSKTFASNKPESEVVTTAPQTDILPTDETDDYVDEEVLLQLVRDTSAEVVPELLALYISDARKRMKNIEISLKERDARRMEFETHTLGSSAAAHANTRLYQLARQVEKLCREGAHEQAFALAVALLPVADESLSILEQRATRGFK